MTLQISSREAIRKSTETDLDLAIEQAMIQVNWDEAERARCKALSKTLGKVRRDALFYAIGFPDCATLALKD